LSFDRGFVVHVITLLIEWMNSADTAPLADSQQTYYLTAR
jgi:hypothetical protein